MAFDTSQMSYVALRNIIAERTNGVVFWIGSGPSADVGVPTWAEFKDRLLEALLDKMHNLADQDRYSLKKAVRLVERQKNNWHAFEILRKELGNATWRSRIRELLRPYASTNAPLVYRKIWRLRPHGILTLNLDRLATKAYAEVDEGPVLTEFSGNQVADYAHVLKNPHPFICHLHGNIEDASSWILTYSDLKRQRESPSYQNFIRSCLSVKTVVFIGIGADDEAVGGFVEDLSNRGIDTGAHYWITERRDMATDRWAEEQDIRLIRYDAPDGNHVELSEMLDDLIAFVSADDAGTATPVIPVGLSPTTKTLSREADLLKMDAESLRNILNEEAGRLLVSLTPHAIEEYNQFSRVYDQAIYRAWYANTESGNNRLLGHILHEEAASGAFGTVYEATDEEGNHVAVKVLHEGIRRNADFLQAFRRGVRSMKILGDNSVQGMVPYRKAFEIPACVVMDWIDGPNLDDAVSSKQVQDWNLILRIGSDIADIVRRGHVLPERVLHRDLRPSNVMLRGFYTHPDKWEVVVLDFDLSWHRGALERSIIPGSAMLGYLAPEQIQYTSRVSTRHAAVDSFGMGMVLFFMMSGRAPLPDEHRHGDWRNTLARAAHGHPCNDMAVGSIEIRETRGIRYAEQSVRTMGHDANPG